MKIAFDTYNLETSGGNGNRTYTIEIIKALAELAPQDQWQLISYWRRKKRTQAIFNNSSVFTVKSMLPHAKILGKQLKWLVKAGHSIFEKQIARSCDLFHCTNPINFPSAMPRVITTIHDLIALHEEPWVSDHVKKDFRNRIHLIIHKSILLFASSEFTKKEIAQFFPGAEQKTVVAPLAADPMFSVKEPSRLFLRKFGIDEIERPYLVTVGEIHQRKNPLSMIKAFESVAHTMPDLHYYFIGSFRQSEYVNTVLNHIATSPYSNRIKIISNVSNNDLVHFYNNALGMAYCSYFEGFGLPIIEAMACGCPVVASDTSSMSEIARGAAFMIDPYSQESINHGMQTLILDKSARLQIQENGLLRAAEYSWKRTAELTYNGYQKVLEQECNNDACSI